MAITEKQLGQVHPADTANTTVYTAPASTTTDITAIRICNTDTSDHAIRLFLVPSGGSAGIATALYYDMNVPANSTLADDGKHILDTADLLSFRSDTASKLTCTISGFEVT